MKIVTPDSHRLCIACGEPQLNSRSLNLRFSAASETQVYAKVNLGESFQGYSNVLHGGVITTLLDAAMTHCLFLRDIEAMTADLSVRFMKPVPINADLLINAELTLERRGVYQLVSHIAFDGEILVRSKAKFLCKK